MNQSTCGNSETGVLVERHDIWIFVIPLLLVLSRAAYWFSALRYLRYLGRSSHRALIAVYLDNYEVGAALLLLIELLVICAFLRPKIDLRTNVPRGGNRFAWSCAGIAVGLLIGLLGPTLTPREMHPLGIANLIINNLVLSKKLILLGALLLALPLPTEYVFRGWMFGVGRSRFGFWTSLFITSLIFAYCWPLTDILTAFLVAMSAAVLYTKTGSILPGLISNVTATISCIAVIVSQRLVS